MNLLGKLKLDPSVTPHYKDPKVATDPLSLPHLRVLYSSSGSIDCPLISRQQLDTGKLLASQVLISKQAGT
jgi:hypothetical protein